MNEWETGSSSDSLRYTQARSFTVRRLCEADEQRKKRHIFIVLNALHNPHRCSGEKRAHTIERFGDSCHSQLSTDM